MKFSKITSHILLIVAASGAFADSPIVLEPDFYSAQTAASEPAYNYNFTAPLPTTLLSLSSEDSAAHEQSIDNRFFMSVFGPRFKSVDTSNVEYFDFHQGMDLTPDVNDGVNFYNEDNPPPVLSMCDGTVHRIDDVDEDTTEQELEASGPGRSVYIRCDAEFGLPGWGNVYLAYRHLSSVDGNIDVDTIVTPGQELGIMGESGVTTAIHLHLSVLRQTDDGLENVHYMRIFDPDGYEHLLDQLQEADVWQLESNPNDILLRVAVPHTMASIRSISGSMGDSYQREYDFESVSMHSGDDRDNNDYISGIELYAYHFNRGDGAYKRHALRRNDIPSEFYPAGPEQTSDNFYPILNEGLLQTPAYILDVRFSDLPDDFDPEQFELNVVDVYGYGFTVNGVANDTQNVHIVFKPTTHTNQDAEENEDGEVQIDGDLDLGQNGSTGGDIVAVLFEELGIPQGSFIRSAFVQFTAYAGDSEATDLRLFAETDVSPSAFSETDNNISDREIGTLGRHWLPDEWLAADDTSPAQKTTDLAELIQQQTHNQAWNLNSSFSAIIKGTGSRSAAGRSAGTLKAPYLYIEYADNQADDINGTPNLSYNQQQATEFNGLGPHIIHLVASDDAPGELVIEHYIDGEKVWEHYDDRVGSLPSYIILSLQVGGWDGNENNISDDFKANMLVDYVRVWSEAQYD